MSVPGTREVGRSWMVFATILYTVRDHWVRAHFHPSYFNVTYDRPTFMDADTRRARVGHHGGC